MKLIIKYLIVFFPLFIACNHSDDGGGAAASLRPVNLNINMKSLDQNVPVRIIITDALSGKILFNESGLKFDVPFIVNVMSGRLKVYALANEPARLTSVTATATVTVQQRQATIRFISKQLPRASARH